MNTVWRPYPPPCMNRASRSHRVRGNRRRRRRRFFSDAQYGAAGAIIADTNTVWEKADLYYKVKELFPRSSSG